MAPRNITNTTIQKSYKQQNQGMSSHFLSDGNTKHNYDSTDHHIEGN